MENAIIAFKLIYGTLDITKLDFYDVNACVVRGLFIIRNEKKHK